MKVINILAISLIISLVFVSCQGNKKSERQVIADKIQYDVFIKGSNPDYDWWIDNLPGPQRESFVDWIFESAESGVLEARDYFDNPLTPENIKSIGIDSIYLSLMRESPPFDVYDTLVITHLEKEDVTKVRFLEKWYLSGDGLGIDKEIIAVAPVLEKFDERGQFVANQPLFWLYLENGRK
jgi:Gliding motility associated protein GldN